MKINKIPNKLADRELTLTKRDDGIILNGFIVGCQLEEIFSKCRKLDLLFYIDEYGLNIFKPTA